MLQQFINQQTTVTPTSLLPTLSSGVVNLRQVRDECRTALSRILQPLTGSITLVLDPSLSGPLGLVMEVAQLKELGVEKIMHLSAAKFILETVHLVYLLRPEVSCMHPLIAQMQAHLDTIVIAPNLPKKREYSVYFAPRCTIACERMLEESGIYSELTTVGEIALDFIPFDDDILSLEFENCHKDCFLLNNRSSLLYAASALVHLQKIFGIIPQVMGKGDCAKQLMDMMMRMRLEMGGEEPQITPEFNSLIIIDREVDMVTPMLTQLTYEGLLDEAFGIRNSLVEVDRAVVGEDADEQAPAPPAGTAQPPSKRVKVPLNSSDKVYSDIRDLNFVVLGPVLHRKAKEIDEYYKKRHDAQTMTQIRDFMKHFHTAQATHASLRIHTNIATKILELTRQPDFDDRLRAEQSSLAGGKEALSYIEKCIGRGDPLRKVLRQIILLCLCHDGLKSAQLELLKRDIVQTYGYQHLFTLQGLERLQLLKRREGSKAFGTWQRPFHSARQALHLLAETDERDPTDISYVFSGYAPLSVRLIQRAKDEQSWANLNSTTLGQLPGASFYTRQRLPNGVDAPRQDGTGHVCLVMFIGGVTFAEISALRFLASQEDEGRQFVVATTKIINGDTLLDPLMERL